MASGEGASCESGWRRAACDHAAGLACILVFLVTIIPVFTTEYLPLHDYPGHIVRIEMILNWSKYDSDGFYYFGGLFLPNVAMDVLVLGLARVFEVSMAGKLFVVLATGLCVLGVACLQKVLFGRIGPAAVVAAMLAVNGIVMWGFLNYVFGLGLMLCGLAAWVALRQDRRRYGIGCGVALVIFFSHLAAFGVYALAIFGFELQRLWRGRSSPRAFVLAGLQFVAPAVLFIGMRTNASGGTAYFTFVESYWQKLEFVFRSITTYNAAADILLVSAVLLLAALMLRGWLRLSWAAGAGLMVLIPSLSFLVLPFSAFGSYFLDARIPIAAAFLGLATVGIGARSRRIEHAVLALLVLIGGARAVAIAAAWDRYDDRYSAVDLTSVRRGDVLFVAGGPRASGMDRLQDWQPPMNYVASYAARQGAFVAIHFAEPRHQPVASTEAYRHLNRLQGSEPIALNALADLPSVQARIRRLHAGPALLLVLRCDRLGEENPGLERIMDNGRECLFRL